MSAFRRKLESVAQKLEPAPVPDFTGWTADEVLVWAARNGGYEEIVARANAGGPPRTVTPEEREAELRAAGKWSEPEPPPPLPEAEAGEVPGPGPGQPTGEPQWWEEKARWRHRGPDDVDDWDDKNARGYFCEFEYDPLEGA